MKRETVFEGGSNEDMQKIADANKNYHKDRNYFA